MPGCLRSHQNDIRGRLISIGGWFDRIDPGTHRRIKGLRLVTAFGLAALLATVPQISRGHATSLGPLAAGFALWASVSEGKTTRYESARDLAFLCIAAGLGAASLVIFTPLLGAGWPELILISGSFCAGFLRRFGVLGSGIGSQILIALSIVVLGHFVVLTESAWAIAACTYVVASSPSGTIDRVRRRIIGTMVGVPLAIACLPLAVHAPLAIWLAAATAMVVYAVALPDHYDIASGAYAFALIVTMAASGEYPVATLLARLWETVVGGALGVAVLLLLTPVWRWSHAT